MTVPAVVPWASAAQSCWISEMSARRCSFRQQPEDRTCPSPAYYLLDLASRSGQNCRVCLCRDHVHKAWGFGQQVLLQRFPRRAPKLGSIRLAKLSESKEAPKKKAGLAKEGKKSEEGKPERRLTPRIAADFEIAYLYGQSLTFTRAVNVSRSGLAFRSHYRFSVGTELGLKLISDVPFTTSWLPIDSIVRRSDGKVVAVQFRGSSESSLERFLGSLGPPD